MTNVVQIITTVDSSGEAKRIARIIAVPVISGSTGYLDWVQKSVSRKA